MSAPLSNLTATWATSEYAVNTAIKMNVTDTLSNSASKLIDLLVGGNSRFAVNKNGLLVLDGLVAIGADTTYDAGQIYVANSHAKIFLDGTASNGKSSLILQSRDSGGAVHNFSIENDSSSGSPVLGLGANTKVTGSIVPSATSTYNLGSSTARWNVIYTSDLDLSNGIGDWTIVEGEDDLFLYNNKRDKVYKFAIIEVSPESAVPKKIS